MVTWLLATVLIAGLYMAWNIGANDVANAMGTSVGARSLTMMQAVLVAACFELAGSVLVGSHVADTVRGKIVNPAVFADAPQYFALGMTCSLLAAAIWLNVATVLGWPVSTTHAIVGAVTGFGVLAAGWSSVQWGKVGTIAASWVVSPISGGITAYLLFWLVRKIVLTAEDPVGSMRRCAPVLAFLVFFVLALATVYKGLKPLHLDLDLGWALLLSAAVGGSGALLMLLFVRRFLAHTNSLIRRRLAAVERVFAVLQVFTACTVAFAHGSNDVANAVGPLAAVIHVARYGSVGETAGVPLYVLLVGGIGIVIGIATYGYRVMATVGRHITRLTPSRGFAAEFGAAITILVGSRLGLPISTTHTLVGAVVGVALARGVAALNTRVVWLIVVSWIITLPFAAGLTVVLYLILKPLM